MRMCTGSLQSAQRHKQAGMTGNLTASVLTSLNSADTLTTNHMKQCAAARQVSQSPGFTYILHYPNVFALLASKTVTTDGRKKRDRGWMECPWSVLSHPV